MPPLRVLASIGWPDVNTYLTQLWAAGGGNAIDGVAFHPYAPTVPDIITLTTNVRARLAALGRPTLPVQITESGQPATYSGPGAARAYMGGVSDAARAATQVLGADALARSDCGIEQFLVYAVTGSEGAAASTGDLTESKMGLLRYADATPNVTGAAFLNASRRWRTAVSAGYAPLALCSQAATPDSAYLPLNLSLRRSGQTCVTGTVGYDGHPLEAATLKMVTEDGRTGKNGTDAFGHAEACLPDGPQIKTVNVLAEVPKTARSAIYRCGIPITASNCEEVVPVAAGTVVKSCEVKLRTQAPRKRRGKTSVKATATLNCGSLAAKTKVRFVVALNRAGHKHDRKVRIINLRNQRKVSFTTTAPIRKGNKLVLLHTASAKTGVPYIKANRRLAKPRS
jgi:hypothetical protein